jgi:predicted nucleic acid-binding protein
MQGVLIDTSVWVDHFRQRNDALEKLLGFDRS